MKILDINEPQKVSYCISNDLRDEQIKINLKKVKGRFEPHEAMRQDPIAIVCFGPSLKETWEELKNFKYIMTCSGAHKFLIDNGIIPTWHVDLEPREHKIQMLGTPHKDVEYLIASTVHPRYFDQLEGYNVKLWHIFANEHEGRMVLPRNEWQVTGGSSVGLRCMTLARLLGFTDLHIFGMDGNIREDGSHTTFHPNSPKEVFQTEYNGKKYLTTPSILHCAKETFRELDQMADVKATFYGDNLVTDMSKDYKPTNRKPSNIAFIKPELISEEYIRLNSKLHQDNPSYGMSGSKYVDTVLKLSKIPNVKTIGDYGCGKSLLAKGLAKHGIAIWEYDPAIPGKEEPLIPVDLLVCTDVLEHIEPDKLNYVLDDMKRCLKKVGYFVISTRQAIKSYANGQNAHLIVQGKDWWEKKLSKFFDIGKIVEVNQELQVVVGPKTVKQPEHYIAEKDGFKFKYLTPNETTKWRAKTLFTKEPSTIEWLDTLQPGEVLYDIGANIGSYTIYAGVKGVKVYAFEPEAENFAILTKNMNFNGLEPNAYQIALSDKKSLGTLYLGQTEAGGACHSFGEEVGHDLQARPSSSKQGCVSFTLDELIEMGLPAPDHLKIDVDGFEYPVILGASQTIRNHVKSIIVETNPSIPDHQTMIKIIEAMGFTYDPEQVKRAERKEGTFKGVAEYVFKKQPESVGTLVSCLDCIPTTNGGYLLADKVREEAIDLEPFNHLYIENFFPKEFYSNLIANMPDNYIEIEKSRGTRGYPERYTASLDNPIWGQVKQALLNGGFKKIILEKFGIKDQGFVEDLILVRDLPGYAIPPHTDSTRKVITALIYLPQNDEHITEGTSIYIPKKKGFTCKDGRHYNFEDFDKVKTMPFKPNSAFIFARTDNSFHGVEPCEHQRDVLLYNINRR